MAEIYQPKGEQVALTGPSRSAGFDPVQAYNPSSSILRAAEWDAGVKRREMEALTGFSETLNKFMFDKVEAFNNQQLNLGIADILNGDMTVDEPLMQEYQQNAKVLEQAADNEVAVSSELAAVNVGAGETYRQQNPVIKGWRAYGQAIGRAQLAASQAEGVLGSFLKDTQTPITVRQADGSIKTFTPAEAESQPELMAAWKVGLQRFIDTAGVGNLNPAILVEHLTPTMLKVRTRVLGDRMEEIQRNRQAREQEEINISIGQTIEGFADKDLGQKQLTTLLHTAKQAFNGKWAQANKFVNDTVLGKIVALGRANPEKADQILTAYSGLLINPDRPERWLIYNRYSEEIEEARTKIKSSFREQAVEEEQSVDKEIESIVNTWQAASQTGNLAQSQRAFDAAEQELTKLAGRYPKATEALSRIRQVGRNYNSLQEDKVEEAVAKGQIKSRAELQILAANGYITDDTANRLSEQLPEDDSVDAVKELRPRMEAYIRNQLRGQFRAEGADFESFKDQTLPLVSALTDELMEAGLAKMLEMKAAGKTTGKAQLQSFLEAQAVAALKTDRFKPIKKGNVFILPTPGKGLPAVRNFSTGPSGRDYSQQIINRLPPVVSAKRDTLLDADKVQSNIDALNNGGQPSPDLVTIAKAAGLPVRTVLQQQAQKYGIIYTPASADAAAKKFEENRKIDPSAASILANPRSTAEQRIRATARLAEAKRRSQTRNLPPNISKFRAAIIGKESGGNYGAVNPDSGALGIGQVMPENVGPWTKQYLGRSLTPQQFLNDPAAQDAVVNGRFKDMIADQQAAGFSGEQMIRRAAAVWYSGQARLWSDTKPQFYKGRRYPSIAEYTKAIWDAYSK